MKMRQTEQPPGQQTSSRSIFERMGAAQIEGERKRLAKMSPAERARDNSLRRAVTGIMTLFNVLVVVGLLIWYFAAYPAFRIPLVVLVLVTLWLTYRKKSGRK